MKEFLEKSLRQQVTIMEDKELYKKFPLVYRGRYDIFKVETNGVVWMAIYPKDNVGLIMLRRDRAKVEKITGLNCAIFLDRTTFYIKEKLLEEGIPFVPKGKQVYEVNFRATSIITRATTFNIACFSKFFLPTRQRLVTDTKI